jgi:hydroxylamine oxidation protein HaoB
VAKLSAIRSVPGLVAGIGAAMLITGGLLTAYAFQGEKRPTPYVYEFKDLAKPEQASLALQKMLPDAKLKSVNLKTADTGKLLVSGEMLEQDGKPGLVIGWKSEIGEPVLRSDISTEEEQKLAQALKAHLPAGSLVFAMPALSQRLAALVPARFPLAGADDSATLRSPDPWLGSKEAIAETEKQWRPAPDPKADEKFAAFLDALGAEDKYGVARLQVMADAQESYLILHVRDAFDIGVASPDRFSVGLRDFPGASDVHDVTKLVKTWVKDEGFAAYAVIPRDENAVRAYYLADTAGKSSLLGQLLPFNSAQIGQVLDATLVYQNGGYWVYRISAVRAG